VADARQVFTFSPGMHPPGRVIFHLHQPTGWDAPETIDGHQHWVTRTACGRLAWRGEALDVPSPVPYSLREREPATMMRRDHADLLGRLCSTCERVNGG
jgi:hypothetical protein